MLPPKAILNFFKKYLPTIETLGKNVASRKKRQNQFDEDVRMWNAYRSDGAVEYRINMDHPLVKCCLEVPSKKNIETLIFAFEKSLPMHSNYHEDAEGSKTLTTEWKEKFEINKKLKDVALFLQELMLEELSNCPC